MPHFEVSPELLSSMFGDLNLKLHYSSPSQQVRRISEDWVARNGYCLRCDSDLLTATAANTRSRDFHCAVCSHGYELKSKCGKFGTRVLDGAYGAMVDTIRGGMTPTFLLLEYSKSWSISSFTAIHHSLITEQSIIPRRPLSLTAKRAGWIGCNILLPEIAVEGKITMVRAGKAEPRDTSRTAFRRLEWLAILPVDQRGWAAIVLNMIHKLPNTAFHLKELYAFETNLKTAYPNNNNIKPKIRQQLQVLRDAGLLNFLGDGTYELTNRI